MRAWLIVAPLLLSSVAQALGWRDIAPGQSSRQDVVKRFGPPTQVVKRGQAEVLLYLKDRAIDGTIQVHFRVDPETDKVHRIDVFPNRSLQRSAIENTYGPSCADGSGSLGHCFKQKLSEGLRSYLHYPSLGLAVFLHTDGVAVFSLTFVNPRGSSSSSGKGSASTGGARDQQADPGADQDAEGTAGSAVEASADNQQSAADEDIFGGMSSSSVAGPDTSGDNGREFGTIETPQLPGDPLKVGGLVYVQALGQGTGEWKKPHTDLSLPSLVDLYLDARPNDRLRAMIVGRLTWDPTGVPSSFPGNAPGRGGRPELAAMLDQFWVNLDVGRTLFITAGRQHVKWGVGRIWSPADILRPRRTDPLQRFDTRNGSDLLKLHLPWERLNWNFYAVAIARRNQEGELHPGVAARAEFVLGPLELAFSGLGERSAKPTWVADFSSALGPLDVYGELTMRPGIDGVAWRRGSSSETSGGAGLESFRPEGPVFEGMAGFSWPLLFAHTELSLGGEYYYNALGYTDVEVLQHVVRLGDYRPFYAARHYAAAMLGYRDTGSEDALSVMGSLVMNLADRSMLARVDSSFQVRRDLTVELFAAMPVGRRGGEFRFSADLPAEAVGDDALPALRIAEPLLQVGLALRLQI